MVIDPGNWSEFIYREDNKNLTLLEMKTKYLQEKLNYDNYRSFLLMERAMNNNLSNSNASAAAAGAGAGGGGFVPDEEDITPEPDPSANDYVVDGYIDNYFVSTNLLLL